MYQSWFTAIERLLREVDGHPAMIEPLAGLVERDLVTLERGGHWGWVIPQVQQALGDHDDVAGPFRVAWGLMYSVSRRLDQIQDHDPTDDPLPGTKASLHYTVILAYYVLAQALLSLLSTAAIPPTRIARLQQLWSDLMLRTASGQYADLSAPIHVSPAEATDDYQRIVHAKTGSAFALALAGVGVILTDDEIQIGALLAIGDLLGALIQYGDDVVDLEQPNETLTLPGLHATSQPRSMQVSLGQVAASIHTAHQERLVELLQPFPAAAQQALLELFQRAFTPSRA